MSEGATATAAKSSSSSGTTTTTTTNHSSSSTSNTKPNQRAPRGGGRGGSGRGRGRGRNSSSGGGGRGRGRGRHSTHNNAEGTNNNHAEGGGGGGGGGGPKDNHINNTNSHAAPTQTNHNNNTNNNGETATGEGRGGRGRGRSGGRGGRSGRGRGGGGGGRGGRGRGGSGRGGRGAKKGSGSDSHDHENGHENENNKSHDEHHENGDFHNKHVNNETLPVSTGSVHDTPSPSRLVGGRGGAPMVLTRNHHPSNSRSNGGVVSNNTPPPASTTVVVEDIDHDSETQKLSESMAAAALGDFDIDMGGGAGDGEEKKEGTVSEQSALSSPTAGPQDKPPVLNGTNNANANANANDGKEKKASNKPKSRKKKKPKEPVEIVPVPEEKPVDVTATDALKALPGQEVSITANTTVQIRRSESTGSLNKEDEGPTKITTATKGKSKKKKGLSKDDATNQKAAKAFNKAVRLCVERSDPDAMRAILHDKHNHNFALDKTVLETVMKAYVMAAMFEDALYCLRNCTLPGTLSTLQTERVLQCLPQNLRNSSAYTAADMINSLCIATEFDNPTSRTYFLRIVRGIALEFLEEVTSARDRICSAPCERLVRSAVCVVDARLKRGKKPTELLVDAGDQLGVFVPDSMENRGIQAGDAVSILPYAGPYPMSAESLDRNMIEATVTNTNPLVLRLQDKTNTSLHAMLTEAVEGNVYRVDKLANRMGFNRQLSSAVAIASPMPAFYDNRRPSAGLRKAITAMDENIDRVMNQAGGMFKGELTSTAALCAQSVPWNQEDETDNDPSEEEAFRMSSRLILDKYGALEGLNASQRLAVEGAVTNRLTLVQGPPGTGKTAVAIRILQHWARLAQMNESKDGQHQPILATSDSNIAVDNLVEGCAAVGLRVVRLGRPEAIRPELLRFCIDRPPSSYSSSGGNGGGKGNSGNNMASAFKERMKSLKNAQIICCTCIGSGGDILDGMTFDRILVDEATQATEPAVLVPLMRGCRQLVLVGDHCQLPPTVLSTKAEEEGHGVPLFSRMVACGVPPFMLDTQYRMHPCIAMFPSDLFYGGKLLNGVSAPERRPLAGFPWPREEFPVAFVPVKGVEMDDGVSKMNEAEAAAACDAVAALLAGGQCKISDIAVVTPYAAQARLIRRLTRRLTQNTGPPYIEVSSVDGFQGREKEAVVFSAVRSNDYGAIGFTSDWRRVNVSFTRARRALIVIGNDQTLRRGDPDTWMPWLAWADAHGLNMDKPGVPRGRYDPEQLRRVRGGTTAAEMLKDVLARQQAQLKNAERQLQKAEKNAAGHIIGSEDDDDDDNSGKVLTLEQDLARLTNTDGNWDDSDDENDVIHRSVSKATLASATSSNNLTDSNDTDSGPVDVWDL